MKREASLFLHRSQIHGIGDDIIIVHDFLPVDLLEEGFRVVLVVDEQVQDLFTHIVESVLAVPVLIKPLGFHCAREGHELGRGGKKKIIRKGKKMKLKKRGIREFLPRFF